MSLPEKEFFQIITPLAPAAVMEKVRAFTQAPGNWARGKKIYLGKIGKNDFQITRRRDRKEYRSGLPLVPWLKTMPKFLRGDVRAGDDGQTIVAVTIEATKAIKGVYIQALTLGLFPIVLVILLIVILPVVFYLMGMPVDFGKLFAGDTMAKIISGSFTIIGAWLGVAATVLLFGLFDISRYRKRYEEIAAFEKQALANLLEGRIEQ